jgi:Rod binding domain-containing protein
MGAAILTPMTPPGAVQLAQPQIAKTWKAAQDFEAMALGQLLAPIFDSVDTAHGPFGGGDGEAAWRSMLTQEIAKHISAHGGLGLAVPVFRQMLQMQNISTETTA